MQGVRREILNRVAAGTLSPEEAAERLRELEQQAASAGSVIRRVRVVRHVGPAEVVGDPSVREAVAEGPHAARRDGDTLVIEGEREPLAGGFSFGRGEPAGFHLGFGPRPDRLLVRMNPELALDIEVQAGNCHVRGVKGPIRGDIRAGSTAIEGFASPLDISVQAGTVKANGLLDEGTTRIRCEAGTVNLHLERGSSARVIARATLGKINLPTSDAWVIGAGGREATIGDGRATVEIDTTMGSVNVTSDQ